jgi:glycosyltransferase involved in cell wall biosynthesis
MTLSGWAWPAAVAQAILKRVPLPLRLKMRIKESLFQPAEPRSNRETDYSDWIARNDTLSDHDRRLIRCHIASFPDKPKFSILMPVYNTPGEYLRQAIDSVLDQLYQDWELCIVDDASTSSEIRTLLEEYARKDARIRPSFRRMNGGIAACTNTALEMASGEWLVLMDHDDVLAEHALYLVAEAINGDPDTAIVYSDEDHIDATGRRCRPYFKPDWDYDLFLGQNLVNHLGAYRADLARRVGGFREGFEGSQDWDFALRVLSSAPSAKVHHIPFVLYHWRVTDDSFSQTSPMCALEAAQRAVNEHFTRTGQAAVASAVGRSNYPSHLRIKQSLPAAHPLVSIIIPTRDQCELLRNCIDGLVNRTDYEPVEIVIVDNGSSEPDALAFLADLRSRPNVKVVDDPRQFNFSRLVNQGVAASSGGVCVLLNNDTDVINSGWLEEMVSHALRPEVGAVGAKLYYANDTLQHGGVILGLGGVAGHALRLSPRRSAGYFNQLNLTRNLSCVTAACVAIRREVYDTVSGFNERDLTVAFNDVDFCIRVRQVGYQIIWTPHAELYHYEYQSRGGETTREKAERFRSEVTYMRKQWGPVLDSDPFYNPNLALDSECFDLAATTRARRPWLGVSNFGGVPSAR